MWHAEITSISPFAVFLSLPLVSFYYRNNLQLSVLICATSPLYPSSKIAFGGLVLIEIIDNGRHRSWKWQNPRIWSVSDQQHLSFLVFTSYLMLRVSSVKPQKDSGLSSPGWFFKPSLSPAAWTVLNRGQHCQWIHAVPEFLESTQVWGHQKY